ncbi:MAG TPA: hypothetical protein VMC85_05910 [Desulfomonilaceae bacterium]|nr:hypothetical protein [Desulfomonilaceae bacterium]
MRPGRIFVVVSLMSLVLMAVFAGSSRAQQMGGSVSYDQFSARESADTVVSPEKSELQASVTTVGWRHGGYWRGGHWGRPYWRGHWRPYHRYGWSYLYPPYPRCWWNGWRWRCGPKRVIIY